MKKVVFHLLGNAHLDPVWLWDWREGLNEGIATVRSILDLMDEDPRLTFIRGESAIYEHIQKHDPTTFERLLQYVQEGRWDVVGGTHIQPDTNLPATETLARHFAMAQAYFRSTFGRAPRVAWAADSFGHSAGLPEILAHAGMTGFAFTRPDRSQVKLEYPAFWWEGPSGSRVLAYRPPTGWYGTERNEIFARFDALLEVNGKDQAQNVGCFYGLGNHGGGPSRHQLKEIQRWADKNPQVEVIHSGLHRFFDALAAEEKDRRTTYPVHRGELNFCLRGCYASVAKFKFSYRRVEAAVVRAEKVDAVIGAYLDRPAQDLKAAWKSVLFNSFHDILPGSSIERAYQDQLDWLGLAGHEAQAVELNALNALALKINTSVPKTGDNFPSRIPFLVWNPHPHVYSGPVEIEAGLDYRPLWEYVDKNDQVAVELIGPRHEVVPFQVIRTEHEYMRNLPWRKRVIFQSKLPPMGWAVYQIGLAKKTKTFRVKKPATALRGAIANEYFRIAPKKGAQALQINYRGKPLFQGSGLSILNVEDAWGSWGGMGEEAESLSLNNVQEKWKITQVQLLESGPERAAIWVRFAGRQSRLDLTFFLSRARPAVDVHGRIFWNERSRRLKIAFPVGTEAEFEVPGGSVKRGCRGEVPGGRWVRVRRPGAEFGFASNALYNFECHQGALLATVVRASRYATDVKLKADEELWHPAVDAGELTFRFILTAETAWLPRLAQELEQPVFALNVPSHPGSLPTSASLFSLRQPHVQVHALKPANDGNGLILRVQELRGRETLLSGQFLGQEITFGPIKSRALSTFRIVKKGNRFEISTSNIQESL